MNKIVLIFIFVIGAITNSYAKISLTGKITAQVNGKPLEGVSIYFPDLKIGGTSNVDGLYKIDHLPETKILIQVSIIGYKPVTELIDLSKTTHKDFILEEAVTELNEVVITGLSKSAERKRTPMPIVTMSATQIKQLSATNIIDAIATLPGIAQVSTGAGISKPVIRGLGYNRVVVVNNGIRQEGQQWGDEHGIEIDEYSINRVEILKGPASLSYGSDAIGGVLNFLPAITLPEGKTKANVLLNYQTNNGLLAGSVNMAGNQKGFIWDFRYSKKMAHAYKNKWDGYVLNSGYLENSFGGTIGLNKSWGYSHINASAYNLLPGIIEGERDNSTGKFIKPVKMDDHTFEETIATKKDFLSYTPLTPYQKINHYKVVSNSNFILKNGSLKTVLGWQQNQRKEFEDVLNFHNYGLYFHMNTMNYDARYVLQDINKTSLSFGTNGMFQHSKNLGTEFLIPDYNLFDFGLFMIAKKSWQKLDISGGLRFDTRNENGKDLWLNDEGEKSNTPTDLHQFTAFHKNYQGFSGSLGAAYQISRNYYTKFNISKGYRAPNIAEITSNGVHEGTLNYVKGSANLKPENSYQVDYTMGINTLHVTVETNVFYNQINNYIFLHKLQNADGSDLLTDGYSTFQYTAGNAHLFGGEFSMDIHPHPYDWLHFENSFSYVQSVQKNQPDSMKYLPLTPASKLQTEIKLDKKNWGKNFANLYLKIGLENYFKQNKFYAAYNTETETAGYSLLNLGMGADIISKSKTLCSVFITINNLTDKAYQNHLSRLKYTSQNLVTQRSGIFNMGRNLSLKIIVPIEI